MLYLLEGEIIWLKQFSDSVLSMIIITMFLMMSCLLYVNFAERVVRIAGSMIDPLNMLLHVKYNNNS